MLGTILPMALGTWTQELIPYALFFGMFFAIFGLSGLVVRHLPRKPGGMLEEILREDWDHNAWDDIPEDESENQSEPLPQQTADNAEGVEEQKNADSDSD